MKVLGRATVMQKFIIMKYKQCSVCGKYKPKDRFQKNRASKDGLYSRCRRCNEKKTFNHCLEYKHKNIQFLPQVQLRNFKICQKCKDYFTLDSFYVNSKNKSKLDPYCKNCKDKMVKAYQSTDRGKEVSRKSNAKTRASDRYKKWRKAYRKLDHVKEAERKQSKKRRSSDTYKQWMAEYLKRPDVIKKMRETRLRRYQKNKLKSLLIHKRWLNSESGKKWYKDYNGDPNTKKKLRARRKKYNKIRRKRYREDPMHRLNANFGSEIWRALKKNKNGQRWEKLVGYTLEDLIKHLQKQFTDGMTWDNYGGDFTEGGWHIDHKIPKTAFNFDHPDNPDFKRCWALKNLQPMWAIENLIKGNTIEKPVQMSFSFRRCDA